MKTTPDQKIEIITRISCALLSSGHYTSTDDDGRGVVINTEKSKSGYEKPLFSEDVFAIYDEIEKLVDITEQVEAEAGRGSGSEEGRRE